MKVPSRRKFVGTPGTVASDGGRYARYESPQQSFEDFLLYLKAVRFPKVVESAEHYAQELKKRGYYTDTLTNYTNALKRWLKA